MSNQSRWSFRFAFLVAAVVVTCIGLLQASRLVEQFSPLCSYTEMLLPELEKTTTAHQKEGHTTIDFPLPSPRDFVLPYPDESLRLDPGDIEKLSQGRRVIHVLSHSHWDREWYLSLEEFRGSLIMELDRVFEMLTNSSYNFHHFHMDGQFLMVEDYLEVRPSMRQTIMDLNLQGKLTLGPFYSQPDVFLSSGEALIRNLLLGMSLSSDMGGTSTVGYLADTFGFIGQMPQLLRGFGIHSFVSGRFAKTGSTEGHWVGPDGSTVLFGFLGNWYCHAIDSFRAPTFTTQQAKTVATKLDSDLTRAGAKSKHRLAMHGCDHFMTDPNVGIKLQVLNEAANDMGIQVVQTNIDDYMRILEKDLAQANLPTVRGEVRQGVDMLINSASTKMSVKQLNFKLQSLLEKWVEPIEAYGWSLNGRVYDSDRIFHAWKPILQTHAHDSICSTSASSVIHDIVNRLARSEQSIHRIIADQAAHVVPEMVRQLTSKRGGQVLLMNPTNTIRSEVFAFTLVSSARSTGKYKGFRDLLRSEMSIQPLLSMLQSPPQHESFELPNTQFRKVGYKTSVTYLAEIHLPPNGVALLELVEEDTNLPSDPLLIEMPNDGTATLENEYVSVVINTNDGSCTVRHVESGHSWSKVNKLWRTQEIGSTYLHKARGAPEYVSELRIVSRKSSIFFSSVRLEGKLGSSPVSITYVLFSSAKGVQIETTVDNSERNNYIATSFPIRRLGGDTNEKEQVDVNGNFEYVDRSNMVNRYVHQNGFTSLYASEASLTVASRGIPEYRVTKANMEMTLMRGVDKIGDWIAGRLMDDVSQELGSMTFQYAVIPDTCRVTESTCTADMEARNFVDPVGSFASWVVNGYRPERYIDLDVSPLSVIAALSTGTAGSEIPQLEETNSETAGPPQLFDLKPAKLVLSAVKKAESKDALVLRAYNPTNETLKASLAPGLIRFVKVKHVLLNENDIVDDDEVLPISEGKSGEFHFVVDPYKIVSLLLFDQ